MPSLPPRRPSSALIGGNVAPRLKTMPRTELEALAADLNDVVKAVVTRDGIIILTAREIREARAFVIEDNGVTVVLSEAY